MFAALPIYARPANRAAHDALWALIRDGLRARGQDAPEALDHAALHDAGWGRADLVLGHICNLPFRARHRGDCQVIGASDYGLEGVPAGHYRSLYVVRADDAAQRLAEVQGYRFALNDPLSQSGWGAPQADMAARGLALSPAIVTGAHTASIAAVATGAADLAAIDAQVWRMETQGANPHVADLRVIEATSASPGMTFVTAPDRDADATFGAIEDAIAALPVAHRETLGLCGIVRLPASDYDIPLPPAPALHGAATPL